jgi:hypothetical protein
VRSLVAFVAVSGCTDAEAKFIDRLLQTRPGNKLLSYPRRSSRSFVTGVLSSEAAQQADAQGTRRTS